VKVHVALAAARADAPPLARRDATG
jgi:hypothetical protein